MEAVFLEDIIGPRVAPPKRKVSGIGIKCLYWLCAGIGFDLSQRLLDHFVDMLTDRYGILAWLK